MSSAPKFLAAALVTLVCGACSDSAEKPRVVAPPVAAPIDAGVVNTGPTATFDPTSAHLDDGPSNPTTGVRPAARRATRPIEIVLRSTPNGARVFVDGEDRGVTPMLWQGETGEHAFTFVKKDHAMARYRFWAITSGIVHARLEPVVEELKAGTPPPELVSPQVPAPPALLTPDANVMTPPDAVPLGPSPTDAAPPATDAPAGSPVGPALPF